MSGERVTVAVEGRTLRLSNLDKVLYPTAGLTKAGVIDYYTRSAGVLLPHLRDRPLTFIRYPDGVGGQFFFEKNIPAHAPAWVQRVRLPSPGSRAGHDAITYPVLGDLPSLVWAANLAALELHVPMWRIDGDGRPRHPDLVVFDLDPGPPATVVDCCAVALDLRELLRADGLIGYPKTSGSKGLQVYLPIRPEHPWQLVHGYAREIAQRLASDKPDRVVSTMQKSLRTGRVLVDWSQNHPAKTTVAPYSLRARDRPTVSTPVSWEEVEGCRRPEDLRFVTDQVLERVAAHGDLLAPLLGPGQLLP